MALLLLLASTLSGTPAAQARGDSSGSSVEVRQSPFYATVPEGGSVNITCSSSGPLQGVYLSRNWPQPMNVAYYEDDKPSTVDQQFQGRVDFSGPQSNLTITMHRLQRADSGTYVCKAIMDFMVGEFLGPGTMVAVTEKLSQVAHECQEPLLTSLSLPVTLAVGFFLLGLGLGVLCTLRRTQIKGMCAWRKKTLSSVVYEDMSYSRRNTLSTPNQYQYAHQALGAPLPQQSL